MKTFASKEEKNAYYKARQIKENVRREKAEAKDRYDVAGNPLGLNTELLSHKFEIEINSLAGSFPATYTVGEMLAEDGQVSQRFWSEWKGEGDGYGLMRGKMSFKSQAYEAGIRVRKLADGRWTLAVKETSILA